MGASTSTYIHRRTENIWQGQVSLPTMHRFWVLLSGSQTCWQVFLPTGSPCHGFYDYKVTWSPMSIILKWLCPIQNKKPLFNVCVCTHARERACARVCFCFDFKDELLPCPHRLVAACCSQLLADSFLIWIASRAGVQGRSGDFYLERWEGRLQFADALRCLAALTGPL